MAEERPGVMLYFEIRPAVMRLSLEQRGALFTAILDFAELGVVPDELDGMAGLCFDLIRPKIERDAVRYRDVRMQKRYAGYCSSCKKAGTTPLSFDVWMSTGDERSLTGVNGCQPTTPTTTTTPTPTPTPVTISATTAPPPATSPSSPEMVGGAAAEPLGPRTDSDFERKQDDDFERKRREQIGKLLGTI